ncbi:MAG: S9 family peptidase [Terricaulis sp.]
MGTLARFICAAAGMLACAASAFAQDAPPPVEAFGRLPAVSDAAISADGTKLALAMAQGDQSIISIIDLDARRRIFAAAVEDNSQLRSVSWADDTHVSFIISRTFRPGEVLPRGLRFRGAPRRVDYARTGLIDVNTQEMRLLTTNEENPWADSGSYLVAPIDGDPGFGRMIGRARGMEIAHPVVYRVNFANGVVRSAPTPDNEDTIGYMLDQQGNVVARIDSDKSSNRWRVFTFDDGRPRLLLEGVSPTGEPIRLAGLLPDGRFAAVDEDESGEFFALHAISRSDGAREVLFQREKNEIDGAINDPWTRQVVGVAWTEVEYKQQFFDPTLQAAYEQATAAFEDGAVFLSSWSRDRSRVVVYAERGLDGGGYYVLTTADGSLRRISMAYPELADEVVGIRQSITYRARDGVRIPAYLTLPPVETPTNLPLVLLVHGGPHARDNFGFDWWASFLASRGYAVLQPNYRGSSGYGASWEHAGRGQWGGLMQTDVEDGVTALARNHVIDPARVCIVGASYGGYAALAGATLTPERYHCAASIAGVSDLNEFLRQREAATGDESMASDFWRLSIGDRQEDRERIRGVSPANLADRVQIPILLIHGTDDTIVPIAQSRRMLDRLQSSGKNVRFVELTGDDHWLSDAPTRIQMLRELETFLAANMPPAAPAN